MAPNMLCTENASKMSAMLGKKILFAFCLAIAGVSNAFARHYSDPTEGCLYQFAHAVEAVLPSTSFSFLPQGELKPLRPSLDRIETESETVVQEPATSQFNLRRANADQREIDAQTVDEWPIFETLRRWRIDAESGLSHNFSGGRSLFALDYSDIFETGRDPTKGGHGMSFFFRHNFRR